MEVDDDADAALARLDQGPLPALLVLNIGCHGPDQLLARELDWLLGPVTG